MFPPGSTAGLTSPLRSFPKYRDLSSPAPLPRSCSVDSASFARMPPPPAPPAAAARLPPVPPVAIMSPRPSVLAPSQTSTPRDTAPAELGTLMSPSVANIDLGGAEATAVQPARGRRSSNGSSAASSTTTTTTRRLRAGSARRREPTPAELRMAKAARTLKTLPDSEYKRMVVKTHLPAEAAPMLRPLMLLLGVCEAEVAAAGAELYDPQAKVWTLAWRAFRKTGRRDVEAQLGRTRGDVLVAEQRVARCLLTEMVCDTAQLKRLSSAALHLYEWCAAFLETCPQATGAADTKGAEAKASHIIHRGGEKILTPAASPKEGLQKRVVHTVAEWLQALKLQQYESAFVQAEVTDLHTVSLLTEEDFVEMGVPIGPKRKFLTAVELLKMSH